MSPLETVLTSNPILAPGIAGPIASAFLTSEARLLTATLGLLPQAADGFEANVILDLMCGTAGWAAELAQALPHGNIYAVDSRKDLLDYARALMQERARNVNLQALCDYAHLPFSDATFDLINARLLARTVPFADWPDLLSESQRILRPGGRLCLVEKAGLTVNSGAYQQFMALVRQAQPSPAEACSANDYQTWLQGVKGALAQAGLELEQVRVSFIDVGDATYGYAWREVVRTEIYCFWLPVILQKELATREKLEALYQRLCLEFARAFDGLQPLITLWATKERQVGSSTNRGRFFH